MEGGGLIQSFYRGKRVLITGHTGFMGAWLCMLLKQLGAEVTGFSLDLPAQPSLFEAVALSRNVHCIEGDVRDFDGLRNAMLASRPEIVIHLAAQSLVSRSYDSPLTTYATNVMGTAHLLEAARALPNLRAIVLVTGDRCYHNRDSIREFVESDPLGGDDPHSSSKGCAELIAASYQHSFFSGDTSSTAIATVRSGNVIGGGDWVEGRLVPDCIRAWMDGRMPVIRNPLFVRSWQHVLEPLWGYLLVAEALWSRPIEARGAWNFGPRDEDAQPVSVIADRLAELWGAGAEWSLAEGQKPDEVHSLRLNSQKARTKLGWHPRTNLDTALQWTTAWYRAYQNGHDAREVSLRQISQFLKKWSLPYGAARFTGFAKAG